MNGSKPISQVDDSPITHISYAGNFPQPDIALEINVPIPGFNAVNTAKVLVP